MPVRGRKGGKGNSEEEGVRRKRGEAAEGDKRLKVKFGVSAAS